MHAQRSPWPAPSGCPAGSPGWYRASDGAWYRSDDPPAPGYVLGDDGRWRAFADAGEAERAELWRGSRWGLGDAWWGAVVYIGVGLVVGVLIVAISGDTEQLDEGELGPYTNAAYIAVNGAVLGGLLWWITRRKGLRSLRLDFGFTARWRDLWIGLAVGIGALMAAGLVANLTDSAFGVDDPTSNVPVDELNGAVEIIVFFLAVAVLTPIVEELFFRGLIWRSFLKRGHSTWVSFTATTAIFTVPHLLAADSVASLVTLTATIAVLGAAFNLACLWTGNRLAAPMLAHAVVNGLAVVVLATG